ncbi:MAG: hypothetical protein DWQ08_08410 [Proteobacteria bacterium]|nr:MAG: hypothetical protein DWQ08_08410 [Pseudomonadota bacterium]
MYKPAARSIPLFIFLCAPAYAIVNGQVVSTFGESLSGATLLISQPASEDEEERIAGALQTAGTETAGETSSIGVGVGYRFDRWNIQAGYTYLDEYTGYDLTIQPRWRNDAYTFRADIGYRFDWQADFDYALRDPVNYIDRYVANLDSSSELFRQPTVDFQAILDALEKPADGVPPADSSTLYGIVEDRLSAMEEFFDFLSSLTDYDEEEGLEGGLAVHATYEVPLDDTGAYTLPSDPAPGGYNFSAIHGADVWTHHIELAGDTDQFITNPVWRLPRYFAVCPELDLSAFDPQWNHGMLMRVDLAGGLPDDLEGVDPEAYGLSLDYKINEDFKIAAGYSYNESDLADGADSYSQLWDCPNVSLDYLYQVASAPPSDPYFDSRTGADGIRANQWAMQRIGLDSREEVWRLVDEATEPVVVAVIDTGIDLAHPDLDLAGIWRNRGEIPGNDQDDDGNGYIDDVIGWNFVEGHNNPYDLVGHGTHVAGTLVARSNNDRGIAGVNPSARVMVLKAMNDAGKGWGSSIGAAMMYAVHNGARIINLSLTYEGHADLLEPFFAYAAVRGVLVVVAAGNEGGDTGGFDPANQPGVLTVGATDADDRRAEFSNYGVEVDVAAPGVDVLGLRARNTDMMYRLQADRSGLDPGDNVVGEDGHYYLATGTSFAAPLVSGLASLVWSRNPGLSRGQVKRMIIQSARDAGDPGIDRFTGYGLVDAAAALRADKDFFVDAAISGVGLVQKGGAQFVQVQGTARADRFDGAWIELGVGENPDSFSRVSEVVASPVEDGVLADIEVKHFAGIKQATLRVLARHADGTIRESRFLLTLG